MHYRIRKKIPWIGSAILLLIVSVHWRYSAHPPVPTIPLPTVLVQHPTVHTMAEYIIQIGNTVASNTVDLVARVEGYLQAIQFVDGTLVKKDSELFIIEPEPYEQKVREAKASIDIQVASHAYAKAEYARQQHMYKENATSLNNVQIWLAKMAETQGRIEKAKANARIAEINFSYTQIKAPFEGRIGRHLIDVGNLVGNGVATNLATIEQIAPIYVYFNLNEIDFLKLRKKALQSSLQTPLRLPIYVGLQNEEGFPHKGFFNFINTGLNASTGTIEMRALFKNQKHALLPGLFVKVRIPLTRPQPELTIPATAIQYDQRGAYLLLVDKNNLVVQKHMKIGMEEKGYRVIKGIQAQDIVIVDGLQNASIGKAVHIRWKTPIKKGSRP